MVRYGTMLVIAIVLACLIAERLVVAGDVGRSEELRKRVWGCS